MQTTTLKRLLGRIFMRRCKPARHSLLVSDLPVMTLQPTGLSASSRQAAKPHVKRFVYDLASGAPGEDTADLLKEHAIRAIKDGHNQYATAGGDILLKQGYARYLRQTHGVVVEAGSEILVVAGSSAALAATFMALCNPDDEIIVLSPYFEGYAQAAVLARAKIVPVSLPANGTISDPVIKSIHRAVTGKTKILMLNNPHNPTGRSFSAEELQSIADLADKHGLIVVADELYGAVDFNDRTAFRSFLHYRCKDTIVIDGISKSENATGWRVAFVIGHGKDVNAIGRVATALGIMAPAPFQIAARSIFYGTGHDADAANLQAQRQQRKQALAHNGRLLARALEVAGFEHSYSSQHGAPYMLARHRALAADSGELAKILLDLHLIKTVPMQDGWVRLCFARPVAEISAACKAIERISVKAR